MTRDETRDLLAGLRSWSAGLPHHKAPGMPGLYAVEMRFDSVEQIKAWMQILLDTDTAPPSAGRE